MINKKKGIKVGFGFDLNQNTNSLHIDLMALMLDSQGKLVSDKHYIFYNNLISPDSSVEHLGALLLDSSDDEQIVVDPARISDVVKRIIFFVNIQDAEKKQQNFSLVKNLYIRFTNLESKTEIAEYKPETDKNYNNSNLIALSELVFVDNKWQIEALGDYFKINLSEFIDILSSEYSYDNFKEKYFKHADSNSYSIKSIIESDNEKQYYKTLEANQNNTDDEIKKKYKELVKSFHPDVIASKNLHKDIVEFANKRFKEIKEAYDFIKEKRKF